MAGQQSTAGTAQAVHPTLKQRGDNATRDLRQAAHLPTNPQDSNVLLTALAEAATREARRNPQFASDIQRTYAQILAMRGRAGQGKSKGAQPQLPPLVALHPIPPIPLIPLDLSTYHISSVSTSGNNLGVHSTSTALTNSSKHLPRLRQPILAPSPRINRVSNRSLITS